MSVRRLVIAGCALLLLGAGVPAVARVARAHHVVRRIVHAARAHHAPRARRARPLAALPPGGRTFHPCAQAMGGSWSDAQVQRYAGIYDLVIVGGSADRARAAAFHRAHPGIQVLAYTGEFDVYNSSPLWSWIRHTHDDWFLRSAGGGHVRTYRNENRYALDPGNAGVRAYFADSARRRIAELEADGVWEDNVFPDWNYHNFAHGERLERYADARAWRTALDGYIAMLERAVAPHHLAVNQVLPWTAHGDIVCMEDLPTDDNWEDRVEAIAGVFDQAGRTTMLLQSLDGPGDPRRALVTASYLLAIEPGAYFNLHWGSGRDVEDLPEYHLALGRPQGRYEHHGGLWWRDWDAARIIVNPGDAPRTTPGGGTLPARSAGIEWRAGARRTSLPGWIALGA